jgi:hypothetical protein
VFLCASIAYLYVCPLLLPLVLQASLAEQYADEEADLQSQTADVAALGADLSAAESAVWPCDMCSVSVLSAAAMVGAWRRTGLPHLLNTPPSTHAGGFG